MDAYARRKKWEARILANEVWSVIGEAMQENKKGKRVSPNKLLQMAGQKL